MKLILTSDVLGLGSPGDVVEVKDGYGRNYLLPRGLATAWTKGGEKQVAQIKRARKAREVRDLGHAEEIKSFLEGTPVRLVSKAGSGGRLFGSIGGADIAEAVQAAGGPALDRRKITIPTPIKSVGTHTATVALAPDVSATVTLEVTAG
jgi:large subunit ribosomal protein L9